jgi:FkbM family methyltransferase
MTYISYSQNFEDVMLMRVFGKSVPGLYVDVGAWHPEVDSVTRVFYERGWRGINLEPNRRYHRLLQQHRPRDVNLNVAAGTEAGVVTFHEMIGSGMSTAHAVLADRHNRAGHQSRPVKVEMVTLTQVFDTHAAGREVAFLKIDVEGYEQAVMAGMDWQRHRPVVVLVEAIDALNQQPVWAAWESSLLNNGYLFAWFDGINRFYVRHESAELLKHFRSPPNLMDGFQLSRHSPLRPRWRTRIRLQLERRLPSRLYDGLMKILGRATSQRP